MFVCVHTYIFRVYILCLYFYFPLTYTIIVTTPTKTQPQHSSWVGHENDFAHPPTQTQHQPLGAPDEHLLTTT